MLDDVQHALKLTEDEDTMGADHRRHVVTAVIVRAAAAAADVTADAAVKQQLPGISKGITRCRICIVFFSQSRDAIILEHIENNVINTVATCTHLRAKSLCECAKSRSDDPLACSRRMTSSYSGCA